MRNASKNTIKRVMRNAIRAQAKGMYFDIRLSSPTGADEYYLFNDVGAQIYRMSKGKICNRGLDSAEKYISKRQMETDFPLIFKFI